MQLLLFLFSKNHIPVGTKGEIIMTTFLTRKEKEIGWTEVEVNSTSDLERVIGTEIRDYQLPMGIHLIYSENSQEEGAFQNFSTAIVEDDGDSQPFFKSVLVAAFGENKSLKPLSKEQVRWLREHSELIETVAGQRVMQINPFGLNSFDRFERKTTVLARKPQEVGFERVELNSLQDRQEFVGGHLDRIVWPLNIDLWVDDEFLLHASNETLCLAIVQKDKSVQQIYGNIFFSSVNEDGDTVSLSEEQLRFIRTHTELFFGQNGELLMIADPYDVAIHAMNGGVEHA